MVRFGLVRSFFDISVIFFGFNEQQNKTNTSPRLRLAHIGHYRERWNSATQGYLK